MRGTVSPLRRYLGHFAPYWPGFLAAAVLMSLSATVPGAAVVLLQRTLDVGLSGDRPDLLPWMAAGFAGLYLVAGAVRLLRTWISKGIAWRVTADLRVAVHERLLRLAPHQQAATGARLATLTTEVDDLQYGVSALVTAFRNPLTLAVLAGTAWAMAPRLAPWALLLLPAVWWTTRWGGRRLRRRSAERRRARSALSGLVHDQLAGLPTVQAFRAEQGEATRFRQVAEDDRRARLVLEVERVLPSALSRLVGAVAVALLLWVGGRQVLAGHLEAGELVGFAVALGLMNRPLGGLSEVWALLARSLASLETVYEILETRPAVRSPEPARPLPSGPLGIRWQGVVVDYGDGPALRGLDLEVAPGEWVALVGPSGAGKSTLLSLVGRVRDPDVGAVRLGGVDVREIALDDLRRAVAVVRQRGFLFGRTVLDNLRLGRPDATREQVRAAAEQAGADGFVQGLPAGYDTPIEEAGRRLSGGERQRLCLARALVMGSPVLLLDEATNQVDATTERVILRALAARRAGQTVISVAHDLSAVHGADRIVVIEGGRVVEQGRHQELLARGGRYAALVEARAGARRSTG